MSVLVQTTPNPKRVGWWGGGVGGGVVGGLVGVGAGGGGWGLGGGVGGWWLWGVGFFRDGLEVPGLHWSSTSSSIMQNGMEFPHRPLACYLNTRFSFLRLAGSTSPPDEHLFVCRTPFSLPKVPGRNAFLFQWQSVALPRASFLFSRFRVQAPETHQLWNPHSPPSAPMFLSDNPPIFIRR